MIVNPHVATDDGLYQTLQENNNSITSQEFVTQYQRSSYNNTLSFKTHKPDLQGRMYESTLMRNCCRCIINNHFWMTIINYGNNSFVLGKTILRGHFILV